MDVSIVHCKMLFCWFGVYYNSDGADLSDFYDYEVKSSSEDGDVSTPSEMTYLRLLSTNFSKKICSPIMC